MLDRRRLLRAGGAVAAGAALGLRAGGAAAGAQPWGLERLGPALRSFPLVGAERAGNRLYLVSRNLVPPRLAVYDIPGGVVVADIQLPGGFGAWAVRADAGGVVLGLFGMRGAPNLYRLRTADHTLEPVAALDADILWDLDVAEDGTIYVVTEPFRAYEIEPDGAVVELGIIDPSRERLRSVAVAGETLFLGGTRDGRCQLRAVDRQTLAAESIVPPELEQDHTVYVMRVAHGRLAAGTRGPGAEDPAIAVWELSDLGSPVLVARAPGESVVDGLLLEADAVYATVRGSGSLVRVSLPAAAGAARAAAERLAVERGQLLRVGAERSDQGGAEPMEPLAVPVRFAENRGVFRHGDRLWGAAANGVVWSHDPANGSTATFDLTGLGLVAGGPERPQSLAATPGTVWAGGSFGFSERRIGSAGTRRYIPGEPKGLALADAALWLALYPGADLWRRAVGGGEAALHAELPVQQNRPVWAHPVGDRWLFVATASDRLAGGGLHVVDRQTGAVESHINPVTPQQHVSGITSHGSLVYVGGSAPDPHLVVWQLGRGEIARITRRLEGTGTLLGLATLGPWLGVWTTWGSFCVVHQWSRAVVHRQQVSTNGGGLVAAHGAWWGVDYDRLYRFDPDSFGAEVIVSGLGSQVWGHPFCAADGDGWIYVIAGTDVARVRVA